MKKASSDDSTVFVPFRDGSHCEFEKLKHLQGDLYAMLLEIKGTSFGGPRTTTRCAIQTPT